MSFDEPMPYVPATGRVQGVGNYTGGGGGGVTAHSALTGLAGDDHTQYHTDARGDVRYSPVITTQTNLVTADGADEFLLWDVSLAAFSKITKDNLLAGITGALVPQGNWDASTNTPALVSSTGTIGHLYIVSVAGTTMLDGVNEWNVGDSLYFANGVWNKVASQGRLVDTNIKTANHSVVIGERVLCDSVGGVFDVTLPAAPNNGDYLAVLDATGSFVTNNVTLVRGNAGQSIQGVASDLAMDVAGAYVELIYISATDDWRILDTPSGSFVPYTGALADVDLGTYNLITDAIQFNTTPSVVEADGMLHYDGTDKTLEIDIDVANGVKLQIGQETHIRIVNKTGVTITDGQVVYINGAQGNRPTAALAQADTISTSHVLGLATQDIADNAEGFITIHGLLRSFDTSGFTDGDDLFLSATVAGDVVNVAPTTPNNVVPLGTALNSTVNGTILVHVENVMSADVALTADSDLVAPTQKAVKAYVDAKQGGFISTAIQTSAYTASAGDRVLCDTSGGTFTVTLPATPTAGDMVNIMDVANSFSQSDKLTLGRNGESIINLADDLDLVVPKTSYSFVYDAVNGWLIQDNAPNLSKIANDYAEYTISASYTSAVATQEVVRFNTAVASSTNFNTGTYTYTAPNTGQYMVTFNVSYQYNSGAYWFNLGFFINGSYERYDGFSPYATGTGYQKNISTIMNLTAGDTLACSHQFQFAVGVNSGKMKIREL